MSEIRLAGNLLGGVGALSGAGHLQIVYANGDTQLEIEVQKPWDFTLGQWDVRPVELHDTPYGFDPYKYASVALDIGGRVAEDVWSILTQVRDQFSEFGRDIEYNIDQNSNSYATTLLYTIGIDYIDYIAAATPPDVSFYVLGQRVDFPGASNNVLLSDATSFSLNIHGTGRGDIIKGGVGGDTVSGLSGDDSLYGGGGNDVLEGGAGSDRLFGGEGFDTAFYLDRDGVLAVSSGSDGSFSVKNSTGTDYLYSVEQIVGSNSSDTFVLGSSLNNVRIDGGFGTDLYVLPVTGSTTEIKGKLTITEPDGVVFLDTGRALKDSYFSDHSSDSSLASDQQRWVFDNGSIAENGRYGPGDIIVDYFSSKHAAYISYVGNVYGAFSIQIEGISRDFNVITNYNGRYVFSYTPTLDDNIPNYRGYVDVASPSNQNVISGTSGRDIFAVSAEMKYVSIENFRSLDGDALDITSFDGSVKSLLDLNIASTADGGSALLMLPGAGGDVAVTLKGIAAASVSPTFFISNTLNYGIGASLVGSSANDQLSGTRGNDTVYGNEGDDVATGQLGSDAMYGWSGNDTLSGGYGQDTVVGDDGNDLLNGDQGNDAIFGGAGLDVLFGDEGDDVVSGELGDDTIDGGAGADSIYGGDGNDNLKGGAGANYIRGDAGDDQIAGGSAFDDINGNMGNDTASGGAGNDWVVGGKDQDVLSGDAGNDIVYGNMGNDTCSGGDGADVVRGGQGDDVVDGGVGDDWISGDRGNDTVSGGLGADTFHTFGDAGLDRILDFKFSEGDRVMLDPGTAYAVSQVGADTVISMTGGGQMILVGVAKASLSGDWIFGA